MKQRIIEIAVGVILLIAIIVTSFYMGARHATLVANNREQAALQEAAAQKALADEAKAKADQEALIAQQRQQEVALAKQQAVVAQKRAADSLKALDAVRAQTKDITKLSQPELVDVVKLEDITVEDLKASNKALQEKSDKDDRLIAAMKAQTDYLQSSLDAQTKRAELNAQASSWAQQALAHQNRMSKVETVGCSILSAFVGYEAGKHTR